MEPTWKQLVPYYKIWHKGVSLVETTKGSSIKNRVKQVCIIRYHLNHTRQKKHCYNVIEQWF